LLGEATPAMSPPTTTHLLARADRDAVWPVAADDLGVTADEISRASATVASLSGLPTEYLCDLLDVLDMIGHDQHDDRELYELDLTHPGLTGVLTRWRHMLNGAIRDEAERLCATDDKAHARIDADRKARRVVDDILAVLA